MTPTRPAYRGVPQARKDAIVARIRRDANHGHAFGMFYSNKATITELDTLLEFSEPIPENDRRAIIRDGIVDVIGQKTVDSARLLLAIRARERKYLARALEPFVFVSSVTLKPPFKPVRFTVGGVRIALLRKHSQSIIEARRQTVPPIDEADLAPEGSTAVQVRVRGRSASHAMQRALDCFDFVRACWNFTANSTIAGTTWSSDSPVNGITIGRVHTAHHPRGDLAFHTYFYQQGAPLATWSHDDKPALPQLQRVERIMRRRLAHVSYADELKQIILHYGRALDSIDYSWAFVQMWGILERLTATEGRHVDTVRRASFVWTEHALAAATLDHLRERRNALVHQGRDSDSTYTHLYQVKLYVEAMIDWHLRNRGKFGTLAEVADFLDLPPDPTKLKALLKVHRRAHTFRSTAKSATPQKTQPVPTS